jgi:predicted aspartyl protease
MAAVHLLACTRVLPVLLAGLFMAWASAWAARASSTPVLIDPGGYPLVDVRFNGDGPHRVVLDTAAGLSTVTTPLLQRLGLRALFRAPGGVHGSSSGSVMLYRLGTIEVAGVKAPAPVTIVTDGVARIAPGAMGILGNNVLGLFAVDLDQPRGAMTFHDRRTAPPAGGGWQKLESYRTAGNFLVVRVLAGNEWAWGVIDTGANRSILNSALAARLGFVAGAPGIDASGGVGGATGEVVPSLRGRLSSLSVGPYSFRNLAVSSADLAVFQPLGLNRTPALLLGNDVLKTMRLWLDYRSGTVYATR